MTRRLHNWSHKNVTGFLKKNGFAFYREVGGSHEAWIKRASHEVSDRIVGLHFTTKSYSLNAMKRIIKESGIDQAAWIKWSNS